MRQHLFSAAILFLAVALPLPVSADPCGMVPPVFVDAGDVAPALKRVGEQMTYLFYADGVETMVLRPGFEGTVDEFGMLIPFPSPPEMRKAPENIFSQIAAAIDPPEVTVDVAPVRFGGLGGFGGAGGGFGGGGFGGGGGALGFAPPDVVRVIREEAVGSYEVAVLEAGSAKALDKWMTEHKYHYPKGMDEPVNDYVADKWCFVAVKARVESADASDPEPGQREIDNAIPEDSLFDGNVQAMEFRFKTDEFVAPMRLSAFNPGRLHNVVYILAGGGARIRNIPEEYVVRQISGRELYHNLTSSLPLRIVNGDIDDLRRLPRARREEIKRDRDPRPHNRAAAALFAADMKAALSGEMLSSHEKDEKTLHDINWRLGMHGGDADELIADVTEKAKEKDIADLLPKLTGFTLTIVDGDFPRETIARQNLTFQRYVMSSRRNSPRHYDAKELGPATEKRGTLLIGEVDWSSRAGDEVQIAGGIWRMQPFAWLPIGVAIVGLGVALLIRRGRKNAG